MLIISTLSKFGKQLGNIMSMNCAFCIRFPQKIPNIPIILVTSFTNFVISILIVKHLITLRCLKHVLHILLAILMISLDFAFIFLIFFLAECVCLNTKIGEIDLKSLNSCFNKKKNGWISMS